MNIVEVKKQLHLVGICPARECQPRLFCTGKFMRKLCSVAGISHSTYLRSFNRWNLYGEPEKKSHSPEEDKAAALSVLSLISSSGVRHSILACGSRVASAMAKVALRDDKVTMPVLSAVSGPRVLLIHIPHPSGRCRLWNDDKISARVRAILLMELAESEPAKQLIVPKLCL